MLVRVRRLTEADWPSVEAIYREGIATGHATFEQKPPTWAEFDAGRLTAGRLVAESDSRVVGWAALSPVSSRPVYRGVAEHSVYIAADARGLGAGRELLDALIAESESDGIWTLQSSVFPENLASLALHERAGFRRVGIRTRIARMGYGPLSGVWRDTVLIERRSTAVGR